MAASVTAANTSSGNQAPRCVSRTRRVRSRVADKRFWGSSLEGTGWFTMQIGLHNKPFLSYDAHGNTKTIGGQTLGYDGVDRHLTTSYGPASAQTTISYTRDPTDRLAARTLSAPGTVRFRAATGKNNAAGDTTLAI